MAFGARRNAIAALMLAAAMACDIPQDPRNTLQDATNDTLQVGVSEAPPWVVRPPTSGADAEPAGVEPELVRELARTLGAEIRWHWGPVQEHMEALAVYELDLAVGGFTRATPWRKHVGMTQPYHVTRTMVAGPPGSAPTREEDLEDRTVAVRPGGPEAGWLRQQGAEPLPLERLSGFDGLVAAPDWELAELGRDTTGFVLRRHRHVLAAPPGENAFIMAVENAVRRADVAALLGDAAGAGGPR